MAQRFVKPDDRGVIGKEAGLFSQTKSCLAVNIPPLRVVEPFTKNPQEGWLEAVRAALAWQLVLPDPCHKIVEIVRWNQDGNGTCSNCLLQ